VAHGYWWNLLSEIRVGAGFCGACGGERSYCVGVISRIGCLAKIIVSYT